MTTTTCTAPTGRGHLRARGTLLVALAAGIGTAACYPLQPAVADVADALGSPVAAVGVALACGQLGYLLGLALLVPLVDRHPARRVVAGQFAALAAVLALSALTPGCRLPGRRHDGGRRAVVGGGRRRGRDRPGRPHCA